MAHKNKFIEPGLTNEEIFRSQRQKMYEINQDENKLKNDIKKGITIIVIVSILVIAGLLIFILSKSGGSNNTNENKEDPDVVVKTQDIGSDSYGYLTIPVDWQVYPNPSGKTIMYASPDNTYIIAIQAFEKKDTPIKEYAEEFAKELSSDHYKEISITTEKVGEYDAYQIAAFSTTANKWNMNWLFLCEDDQIHYIAFEAPFIDNEFMELPYTFRLKKEVENTEETKTEENKEEEKNTE